MTRKYNSSFVKKNMTYISSLYDSLYTGDSELSSLANSGYPDDIRHYVDLPCFLLSSEKEMQIYLEILVLKKQNTAKLLFHV